MPRMATFVHLTPAANGERISRSGVAARSVGRIPGDERRGVFLFPVLRDHVATHQWWRVLVLSHGRGGVVTVLLGLPASEEVRVGRFDEVATSSTAADAVARIAGLTDPRGWEVFLPRAVSVAEVRHVRELRRPVGWRHVPDAHTAPRRAPAGDAERRGRSGPRVCSNGAPTRSTVRGPASRSCWHGWSRSTPPTSRRSSRSWTASEGAAEAPSSGSRTSQSILTRRCGKRSSGRSQAGRPREHVHWSNGSRAILTTRCVKRPQRGRRTRSEPSRGAR